MLNLRALYTHIYVYIHRLQYKSSNTYVYRFYTYMFSLYIYIIPVHGVWPKSVAYWEFKVQNGSVHCSLAYMNGTYGTETSLYTKLKVD